MEKVAGGGAGGKALKTEDSNCDLRAVSHRRDSSDSGETVMLSSPELGRAPDAPLSWPRR